MRSKQLFNGVAAPKFWWIFWRESKKFENHWTLKTPAHFFLIYFQSTKNFNFSANDHHKQFLSIFSFFFGDSFFNYRKIEIFLNAEKTSWDDLGSSTNDVQVNFWHVSRIQGKKPIKNRINEIPKTVCLYRVNPESICAFQFKKSRRNAITGSD